MRRLRLIGAVALCLLLSACAAGPKFAALEAVPPGKAQIYFLRDSKLFGAGMPFDIVVDGKRVGTLASGGYLPLTVTPGKHWLGARVDLLVSVADRKTELTIAEGGRAFVLVSIHTRNEPNKIFWSFGIDEANDEFAMRLLPGLSRMTASND